MGKTLQGEGIVDLEALQIYNVLTFGHGVLKMLIPMLVCY